MATVRPAPVRKPNTPTPRANKMARRMRSRSSCTSSINNSKRFLPMANSRRATGLGEALVGSEPLAAVSITGSVAIVPAAGGDQITENRTDPEGDPDGLIGMLAHRLVRRLGAGGRFLADAVIDLFAAFQRGSEAFAGFADFFSGDIGRAGHQGARVFGQRANIVVDCLFVFFHSVRFFHSMIWFNSIAGVRTGSSLAP